MPPVVIETYDLTKRYGTLTAVDRLGLSIYEGEIFGLLGPNGAGKTTTIAMICGVLRPDAGEVRIGGKPAQSFPDYRSRIGVAPQNNVVWDKLTCLEQLQFVGEMYNLPARTARQRARELLGVLDLVDKSHRLASTLSGGMRRRLNLALALVHDPEILALDEPEAGLDPQSRVLIREYIRSLARRKTILLTTHNMDEAERMADRVAIIDHGKLLVVDTPEALKRTVGEGDVLEIELKDIAIDRAVQIVQNITPGVTPANHGLLIRTPGLVERLPAILEALQRAGAHVEETRLRANTLEDVFIQLTGRRLRE